MISPSIALQAPPRIWRWTILVLTCCSLALLSTKSFADPLPFFKANYQANIKGFSVKASRELYPLSGNRQALVFKASSMIASMEEKTTFYWDNNRLIPTDYEFLRNVIGNKTQRSIRFDHKQKNILSQYDDNSANIPYSSDVIDELAYQIQLQYDLLSADSTLAYNVIKRGRTKTNQFQRMGDEIIETKLGKLHTTKVSLSHNTDQRATYIWFAKDWNNLLVRFEQYEKGKKEFVINLTDAIIADKTVTGL